jgi:hypothetical protein
MPRLKNKGHLEDAHYFERSFRQIQLRFSFLITRQRIMPEVIAAKIAAKGEAISPRSFR